MSGRDGEMFAFDSSENIHSPVSSIESVNFGDDDGEESNYLTPMNYQTARRIELAKLMLRNHSLLAHESLKSGEPISLIKAKLKAKLRSDWTPSMEYDLFQPSSSDPPLACREYTIVTPSHTFIEIDNVPHNGSFVSSYGGTVGSYKTFSPGSFKSADRLKNFK